MSAVEAKNFFGSKIGTYHWDEVLSDADPHGYAPHFQIYTYEGPIIRIFFPGL